MSTDTIQQIDANIKEARKAVDAGDALQRLRNNKDFKKVVIEGYFEREAVRLVHLKADPAFQSPEKQESIVRQMDAIGAVSAYFTTTLQIADMAARDITSSEEEREVLMSEELNND